MTVNWLLPTVGVVVTVILWRRSGPGVTVTASCDLVPIPAGRLRVVAHQNLMLDGRPVVVDQIADVLATSEVTECLRNGAIELAPLADLTRILIVVRPAGRQTTMVESGELGLPSGTFQTVPYAAESPLQPIADLRETKVGPSSSALRYEMYVVPLARSPVGFGP